MLHWIKFNLVGVLGFGLQSAVLFLLTHIAYPISYLAATAVAVELAVSEQLCLASTLDLE